MGPSAIPVIAREGSGPLESCHETSPCRSAIGKHYYRVALLMQIDTRGNEDVIESKLGRVLCSQRRLT
jgi:hypothetical protein